MLRTGKATWRPNLFVAGFAKCGTTELSSILSQHPDIFAPWEKEPNTFYCLEKYPAYFSGDKTGDTRHTVIESSVYQKMYSSATGSKYRIDATVSYTFDARFARLLKELFPDARAILVLRNQKQRLISMYFHSYIVHRERDFPRWLAHYFIPFSKTYLYRDKLRAYREAFGDDLRVVETGNLGSEMMHRQLFRFLDVRPIKVKVAHKNTNYLGPGDGQFYRDSVVALSSFVLKGMRYAKRMGFEHEFNRMMYAADDFVRGLSNNKKRKAKRDYSEMIECIPGDIGCMLDQDYAKAIEYAAQNDMLLTPTSFHNRNKGVTHH